LNVVLTADVETVVPRTSTCVLVSLSFAASASWKPARMGESSESDLNTTWRFAACVTQPVGTRVGAGVGSSDGAGVGVKEGWPVGSSVGESVGDAVGSCDGAYVGTSVGTCVGSSVGSTVG
jgi:hypothetical protein